jgi:hypothetical protein
MPDESLPFHVEVRISRTRRRMLDEMRRCDGVDASIGPDTQGLVRHWMSKINGRFTVRPRGMVARMYLNVADLRVRPSEIVSHECTHAGMAWARIRGANLKHMPGEEVLCYAVGAMVKQVNRACYAHGVWT